MSAKTGPRRGLVRRDIERALAGLSFRSRVVVLLALAGFNEHEMAEILGWAVWTVRPRLALARATLMRLMSGARGPGQELDS
jgi:DNA-directed RNA polymerase specialized sigma24 family protein